MTQSQLLEACKLACRISSTTLDDEFNELIATWNHNAEIAEDAGDNFGQMLMDGISAGIETKRPHGIGYNVGGRMINGIRQAVDEGRITLEQDAEMIGGQFDGGISAGIKEAAWKVKNAVRDLANVMTNRMRDLLGIHSPSTVGFEIGDDWDEGIIGGVEAKKGKLRTALSGLAGLFTDEFAAAGHSFETALAGAYGTTLPAASTLSAEQAGAYSQLGGKLDLILGAIRTGRVIMLDGDTLVGATAERYDEALGSRAVIAGRGKG